LLKWRNTKESKNRVKPQHVSPTVEYCLTAVRHCLTAEDAENAEETKNQDSACVASHLTCPVQSYCTGVCDVAFNVGRKTRRYERSND